MKNIVIVLAAGVIAGLSVYGIIEWQNLIIMNLNGVITMQIASLVGIIAGVGFISAMFALLFRRAFQRADDAVASRLEQRLERLEAAARVKVTPES